MHERRAAADAIVVGTGTVLADDPSLTARGDGGELLADQPHPGRRRRARRPRRRAACSRHPHAPILERTHDLAAVLDRLYDAEVRHVFVEGGPTLATAFVAAGLVDEFLVYLAPTLLGGPRLALGDLGVDTIADAHRLDAPLRRDPRRRPAASPPARGSRPSPPAPQKET